MYFPVTPGNLDAPGTLRIKYSYCNVGETSIISQFQEIHLYPTELIFYKMENQMSKTKQVAAVVVFCQIVLHN